MSLTLSLAKKTLIGTALGLLAAGILLVATRFVAPTVSNEFEAQILDLRYLYKIEHLQKQRRGAPIEEVVIVDIDSRSLEKLGRFPQWPRSYHAQIIDRLNADGAAAICFDILFMEQDANPQEDQAFAQSVMRAGNVVNALAFSKADENAFQYAMQAPPAELETQRYTLNFPRQITNRFPSEDRFNGKFHSLYNNSAALGFANFLADEDDTIRKMPLFLNFAGQTYPSLALAVVMQALGVGADQLLVELGREVTLNRSANGQQRFRIPIDNRGQVLVNYFGGYQTFRYVSYYDVLAGRLPKSFFNGKIVLVGTSAPGLYDLRVVPFQNDLPGVEIHANLIYSILTQDFILKHPDTSGIAVIAIAAVLIGVITILLKPWASILGMLSCAAGYLWLALWAFVNHNVWMLVVQPLQVMFLSFLIVIIYRYISEERQKKFIYNMFGNYLSDNLIREMVRNPKMLKLGGERMHATAFFMDIPNFTTISEQMSPEASIAQLNEYLSEMTEVVFKYHGYLDKYEGDAIVAAFGVPMAQQRHAEMACFAALDMQSRLALLHDKWRQEKRPLFGARIGINSGAMIAGNIGGRIRFDYTVIGDSVNLAARLESVNKMYGTSIIIGEDTYQLVKAVAIVRELDYIRVKGKTKPVRIYELLARRDEGISQHWTAISTHYARGLELYRLQEWHAAITEFRRVLEIKQNDGPATELLRRCEIFMQSPRPADWDGVFEMQVK